MGLDRLPKNGLDHSRYALTFACNRRKFSGGILKTPRLIREVPAQHESSRKRTLMNYNCHRSFIYYESCVARFALYSVVVGRGIKRLLDMQRTLSIKNYLYKFVRQMKTHLVILIGRLHGTPFYCTGWSQFYVMSLILSRTLFHYYIRRILHVLRLTCN